MPMREVLRETAAESMPPSSVPTAAAPVGGTVTETDALEGDWLGRRSKPDAVVPVTVASAGTKVTEFSMCTATTAAGQAPAAAAAA